MNSGITAMGTLAIIAGGLGALVWYANRAGRNAAKVTTANERADANMKVMQIQQATAQVAARPITDEEYERRMMDGTA